MFKVCADRWNGQIADGQTDGRTEGQPNGRMDGWVDGMDNKRTVFPDALVDFVF